ncbi:MAG TPA: NAD(P)H-dependent oxidoreductase, partial [Archangium sp.]
DTSDTNPPASIVDAKARIRAANGLLVVTPEYNRGLPGSLKNLFDFLSRPPKESPFGGKVVTNMGATPGGFATMSARNQFRQLADALGMITLPGEFAVSQAHTAFDDHGQLKDEKRRADLSRYLDRYVALLQQFTK